MNKWAIGQCWAPETGGDAGAGGGGGNAPAAAPPVAQAPSASAPAPGPAASAPVAPKPDDAAGYWPSDWKSKIAGDDAEAQKQVGRYATPADIWKKARELETKLSSGSLKPVLTKDATAEDLTSYRKAHGIPETPDKYDLSDLKVEPQDKDFMAKMLKVAHDTHQKPEQIKPLIKAFFDLTQESIGAAAERDKVASKEAEDALRLEWGQDYRRHTNLINGLMDLTGDANFNESLMNGRLADGTMIKDSPAAQKFLLQLALINNPVGVVVPSSNGSQMQGMDDEIKKIETLMKTNRTEYNKDAKMQERLRALYTAREGMKDRKAA